MDTGLEFHAEAPQATASEGLAQGPDVAVRVGFEPTTFQSKGDESTKNLIPRDVPVIHPVPGKCRISHYSVLPGPCKIMEPSNKKKFCFTFYYRK